MDARASATRASATLIRASAARRFGDGLVEFALRGRVLGLEVGDPLVREAGERQAGLGGLPVGFRERGGLRHRRLARRRPVPMRLQFAPVEQHEGLPGPDAVAGLDGHGAHVGHDPADNDRHALRADDAADLERRDEVLLGGSRHRDGHGRPGRRLRGLSVRAPGGGRADEHGRDDERGFHDGVTFQAPARASRR